MADSRQVPVRSYAVVFLVLVAGVVIVSVAELNLTAGVTAGGCTDPDGNNTYAPGTAKVYSYGRETAYEDRCISNFAVIEYSCKAFYRHATRKYEKRLFSNAYECPFGCYKGACLRQDEGPKCLETDAADFDAYKEGATRVAGGNERWDYCEGNTLVEYSCDAGGQYLGEKRFDCDYGCEFGACLRQPKIVTAQFRASIAGVSDDNKLLKNSLKSGSITGYVRYSHRALAAAPPTAVYDFGDSFHLNLQIDGYGDLSRTEESVGPYPSEGGEAETVATNYVQYRLGTEEDSGGFESGSLEVTDNGESGDAISIGTKGTRPLFWSQSGDTNIVVESIFINLRDESGGAILDSSLPLSFDIDAWKSRDLIIQFASASDPLQKGTIKAAIDWQMRDCIDAENGRDYYRDMDVYQTNFKQEQTISSSAPDSCITGNVLRETYCRSDTYDPDAGSAGVLDSVLYKCPNSCRQVRDENRQSFVNVCVPDQILFDSLSVSPAKAGALQEVNFSSAAYAAENPVKLSCGFSPGAKDACESPDFVFLNPLCSAKVPGAFSGTKKVYCRVVDDAGAASEERSAEFEATAPPPPSFTALLATPSTVSQGQFVTFSATGSSQSGTVKLDCGTSSGAKDACEGAFAGANPSCTKTVPSAWTGAKTVYCRIRDNLGVASGERSVNISVTTAAQNQTGATAFFSVSAISEIVFKGQNISFRGNGNTSVSNMIKLYCGTMPGYSDICEGKFSTKTSSCAAATGSWQTGIGYAYCRISDAQGTVSDDKTARFLVMDPGSVSGIAPKVCIDGNGDGLPDVVQTDSTGRRYCLEAYAAKAFVGEHVPAVIYAWHEDGIKTLSFSSQSIDFVMSSKLCAFAKWCNLTSAIYPQGSPETFVVDASIRSKNGTYIKTQFSVQVACRNPEYCRPNTDFTEFFNWTRSKGYSECITSRYISRTVKPEERAILKGFLLKRPSNITQPYTIHFYDIIPTDENS
ncbi:MAG: hypothetical protein HYW25_06090, partial [Candidatus Aenigmarchaeota archaeon]|nr:hypothetical protein [Candidatus Aenigmarchaeota archaeon]